MSSTPDEIVRAERDINRYNAALATGADPGVMNTLGFMEGLARTRLAKHLSFRWNIGPPPFQTMDLSALQSHVGITADGYPLATSGAGDDISNRLYRFGERQHALLGLYDQNGQNAYGSQSRFMWVGVNVDSNEFSNWLTTEGAAITIVMSEPLFGRSEVTLPRSDVASLLPELDQLCLLGSHHY
jgi:hypothetical protein